MTHIVLTLDRWQAGGTVCGVAFAPFPIDDLHQQAPVTLDDLMGLGGPDAIRTLGERLAERIRGNQKIGLVLDAALMIPHAQCLPICFRVSDEAAHSLSWEALIGNQDFVALDPRWPIARIPRGGNVPPGAFRPFDGTLKLAAVLSAVGRSARAEFDGLHAAVVAARAAGLPVEVTLFAGEEQEVIDVAGGLGDAALDVRPVPAVAADLIAALRDLEPHLLHMFCHGSISSRVRLLEIGTIGDFLRDDGVSSVIVRVDELGAAMAEANTWAVVLNTCRGADAQDEGLTHAEGIVNAGVPVAVGMRRMIDADDAFAFSAALYPAVFDAVRAAAAAPPHTISWPATLVDARRQLRDRHGADPARHDVWTLPVLYTRTGSFELVPAVHAGAAAVTEAIGERETLDGIVDVLGDSAPEGLIADLQGMLPA